ncbi:citrate/2-methylcitrate synthase [Kitasatospora paranensis]|uniref:citrate synthase (unknown stereospecificity) n=1 Tax=Kitasatospora paranensis TaxID=258053 RepID=A0ABW2FZT0_9ACTN
MPEPAVLRTAEPRSDTARGPDPAPARRTADTSSTADGTGPYAAAADLGMLVGHHTFDEAWGILVDGRPWPGLGPGEPLTLPMRHGDVRVDVQSALATLGPAWGLGSLHDIGDEQAREDLERTTIATHTFVAQSARGLHVPAVPYWVTDAGQSAAERFLLRWRGQADPRHVRAVDAYWCSAAVHPVDAATTTARVIASTGADVATCLSGAVAAMAGPRFGAAPATVLRMIGTIEHGADARATVRAALDGGDGLPLFAASPPGGSARGRALREATARIGAARFEAAVALEEAACEALREQRPDTAGRTGGGEFWAAVLLDSAGVPPQLFTAMAICGRTADWSAHVLDRKRTGEPATVAA